MRFLLRRLISLVLVTIGITLVTFVTTHIFPADPAALLAAPGSSPQQIAQIRHDLGLDRSLPEQYLSYLEGLAHGNLGQSIQTNQPVASDIKERLPATLELAIVSMIVYVVVAIPLGTLAAVTRGSAADLLIRLVSVAGLAVPVFWLGLLFQLVFFRQLGIFSQPVGQIAPTIVPPRTITGFYLIDATVEGNWEALRSTIVQLILPVSTLVISRLGVGVKMMRTTVLEVLGADYVRTARAKGLSERTVVWRHVVKNALIPVVTMLGIQFGYLLGGTLVVEVVFGWPGIGQYAIGSITSVDFPAIMGVTVVISVFFVLVNTLVDILYFYLDPRLRPA